MITVFWNIFLMINRFNKSVNFANFNKKSVDHPIVLYSSEVQLFNSGWILHTVCLWPLLVKISDLHQSVQGNRSCCFFMLGFFWVRPSCCSWWKMGAFVDLGGIAGDRYSEIAFFIFFNVIWDGLRKRYLHIPRQLFGFPVHKHPTVLKHGFFHTEDGRGGGVRRGELDGEGSVGS